MCNLTGAAEFIARTESFTGFLRPSDGVHCRIKARLALAALFMADARHDQLGGSDTARAQAAPDVATACSRDPTTRGRNQ